jgi:hypothetical protein
MLVKGGKIKALRLEHCWVEVWVTYDQYQGARQTDRNKMWIPLDPSFKLYEEVRGVDFAKEIPFDGEAFMNEIESNSVINETEGSVSSIPAELILEKIMQYGEQLEEYIDKNNPSASVKEIMGYRRLLKEKMGLLPCTLPYDIKAELDKYSEIANNLRTKISFEIPGSLSYQASMAELAGKRITLWYLAATAEDERVIKEYGDIFKAPAYLIEVKPVIVIDGETKASGSGIGLGNNEVFNIRFSFPDGTGDMVSNVIKTGAYYGISLTAGEVTAEVLERRQRRVEALKEEIEQRGSEMVTLDVDDVGGEYLSLIGLTYFGLLDLETKKLAQTAGVRCVKQLSGAITGTCLEVEYFYGVPRKVEFSGLEIDVDRNIVVAVGKDGDNEKVRNFALMRGELSSELERGVFSCYLLPSISTMTVLREALRQGVPVYSVSFGNLAEILPKLEVGEEVKADIRNAVNSGKVVTIPGREVEIGGWRGVGYIVMDPETCEAGYMISGGIAGAIAIFALLALLNPQLVALFLVCSLAFMAMILLGWTIERVWSLLIVKGGFWPTQIKSALQSCFTTGMQRLGYLKGTKATPLLSALAIAVGAAVSLYDAFVNSLDGMEATSKTAAIIAAVALQVAVVVAVIVKGTLTLKVLIFSILAMLLIDGGLSLILKYIESKFRE